MGDPAEDHRYDADVAPGIGEAAVLSALAVRVHGRWQMISGSLLTCPFEVAMMSWRQWTWRQPAYRQRAEEQDLDFGPVFTIEPSKNLRAIRAVVPASEWTETVDSLHSGHFSAGAALYEINIESWGPRAFLESYGGTDAHAVTQGVGRPVTARVAVIRAVEVPEEASAFLNLACPPYLSPGPDLGRMHRHRSLVHWPEKLLGISWVVPSHDDPRWAPPNRLVFGRVHDDIWIVGARPNFKTGHVEITIGWDENKIDPLGCSLFVRSARDELTLLARNIRISDLPANDGDAGADAWKHRWDRRTLTVEVPRGPRRTAWGAALLGADGRLLDERPVVRRVEQITNSFYFGGSTEPSSVAVSGDPDGPPTDAEVDEAVAQAIETEHQSREAAARRRFSTSGELEGYLRWRLGCRAGEILVLDPSLVRGSEEDVQRSVAFLASLGRPIRALCTSVSQQAKQELADLPQLDVRALPGGARSLHDRFWIIGETGLAVGASPGGFLPATQRAPRASTATELAHGDTVLWRSQFEQWWSESRSWR